MKIETKCLRCGITIFRSETAIKRCPEKTYCKNCLKQNRIDTMVKRYGSLEKAYQLRNQKTKENNLQKYGTENPWALQEVKNKRKLTCLKKYGVESPFKSKECMDKAEKTFINHYGVKRPAQAKVVQDKMKATCLERYGVENYNQSEEAAKHHHTVIEYNGLKFDSKDELIFYKKCIELNLKIERCLLSFKYMYNNEIHYYHPDFIINNMIFEIKGSHFLNEDGTWKNPFDRTEDGLYEAKRQCAIQNCVNIIYDKDIKNLTIQDFEKFKIAKVGFCCAY